MSALLVENTRQPSGLKVDESRAIIFGVKCLGWKSANRRSYCPQGIKAELYLDVRRFRQASER